MAKIYGAKRRDYSKKKFANPFFSKNRKKRQKVSIKTKAFLVFVGLVFIGLIYLFFYSPIFIINKINVNGTENIDSEQINKIAQDQLNKFRFLIFKQNNIFIFNKELLRENIASEVVLDELKIDKKLLHTLNISLKERYRSLVWISQGKYYYLDPGGVIIEKFLDLPQKEKKILEREESLDEEAEIIELELPELEAINDEYKGLYEIIDLSNTEVTLGQTIIKKEVINFISKLPSELPIEIDHFEMLNPQSREVNVVTKEGWKLYLDSGESLENQIISLNTILREKIDEEKRPYLEYIDVRLINRVYFK